MEFWFITGQFFFNLVAPTPELNVLTYKAGSTEYFHTHIDIVHHPHTWIIWSWAKVKLWRPSLTKFSGIQTSLTAGRVMNRPGLSNLLYVIQIWWVESKLDSFELSALTLTYYFGAGPFGYSVFLVNDPKRLFAYLDHCAEHRLAGNGVTNSTPLHINLLASIIFHFHMNFGLCVAMAQIRSWLFCNTRIRPESQH